MYVDKKRTQELLRGLRLQLPKSFSNLKFNTIIHESNNVVKSKFSLKNKPEYTSARRIAKSIYDDYGVRGRAIKISHRAKSDFGDRNAWYKSNYGYITISDKGIPVDSYYKGLSAQYPQFFNESREMTESNRLQNSGHA